MKQPKLSILIPTIPSRLDQFKVIYEKIDLQARDRNVEILWVGDNKKRSIGLKRDALVQISKGEYVAFVDDDDDVSTDYIIKLLQAIEQFPDVITFRQLSYYDKTHCIINFDLHNSVNEPFKPVGLTENPLTIKRRPFHVCAFRGDIARRYHFPDKMWGEDWEWCEQVLKDVKTQVHIDEILHIYRFNTEVTEAR